ncbi:MAG: hypothetical protein V4623_09440, partial [Pseudomonadota bacterium]
KNGIDATDANNTSVSSYIKLFSGTPSTTEITTLADLDGWQWRSNLNAQGSSTSQLIDPNGEVALAQAPGETL